MLLAIFGARKFKNYNSLPPFFLIKKNHFKVELNYYLVYH